MKEFLIDFSKKFEIMNKQLILFNRNNYSSFYFNYNNDKFLKAQCKFENQPIKWIKWINLIKIEISK